MFTPTTTVTFYFVQPIPCEASLMHLGSTSLIWRIQALLEVLVVYFSYFGSPMSIYYHIEPPTHLYLLIHAFLGLINDASHFTNVHTLVSDYLGWDGAPLVHLGGIEVKYHHDTCTFPIGSLSLTNFVQCVINVYHNIYKMYCNNMTSN